MRRPPATRATWYRAGLIGVVLIAVLAGLEYLGIAEVGYGFAVVYSVAFALTWALIDTLRRRSDGTD